MKPWQKLVAACLLCIGLITLLALVIDLLIT